MENEKDRSPNLGWVGEIPIRSEDIAFKSEDLIPCLKCSKANPPNRSICLYCGDPLDRSNSTVDAGVDLRPVENWENGYNIVFLPPAAEADVASASVFLSIDPELLGDMLALANPFPLIRIASASDAKMVTEELRRCGLSTTVVSDESLMIDRPPVRLRRAEVVNSAFLLTAFNSDVESKFASQELLLIVSGSAIESKTESVEKRKKKETRLLDQIESASNEKLFDLYFKGDEIGFRVLTKGFDFSVLGAEMGILAPANIDKLRSKFLSVSLNARSLDYNACFDILKRVWTLDEHKEFHGLKLMGLGRKAFSSVVATTNLAQFTKYSRLQRRLYEK